MQLLVYASSTLNPKWRPLSSDILATAAPQTHNTNTNVINPSPAFPPPPLPLPFPRATRWAVEMPAYRRQQVQHACQPLLVTLGYDEPDPVDQESEEVASDAYYAGNALDTSLAAAAAAAAPPDVDRDACCIAY